MICKSMCLERLLNEEEDISLGYIFPSFFMEEDFEGLLCTDDNIAIILAF